jgi:flavin reductase (DIM6/NTAB) family NADH-FMN oxidoreductase RutF
MDREGVFAPLAFLAYGASTSALVAGAHHRVTFSGAADLPNFTGRRAERREQLLAESKIDTRELRSAFGCFATGIAVVTTVDSTGRAIGKTANSFTSVSLDPPLVLWCLNKRSVTFDAFHASPHFVVSVLGANGGEISKRFATFGNHVVEDNVPTVPTTLGPPTFPDALAVFECETYARYDGGDHVIVVGRVVRFSHHGSAASEDKPLLFYRGRYTAMGDPID